MGESITLYGFGDVDRSGKVRWLAHELGLDVEEARLEFRDQVKPAYLALNPFGQIPTAVFREQTLIESTAACHAIAEAFDAPKLWIGRGEPERAKYLFWLATFGETLEGRLVECAVSRAGILAPEYFALREARIRPKLSAAAQLIPKVGFLAGERFTVADVLAGYGLRLAVKVGLLERAAVEPYFSRLVGRPAAIASRVFASL